MLSRNQSLLLDCAIAKQQSICKKPKVTSSAPSLLSHFVKLHGRSQHVTTTYDCSALDVQGRDVNCVFDTLDQRGLLGYMRARWCMQIRSSAYVHSTDM